MGSIELNSGEERISAQYIADLMQYFHDDVPSVCACIDQAMLIVLAKAYKGDMSAVIRHIDRTRQALVKILLAPGPNGKTH